jgi:hypothetical protein
MRYSHAIWHLFVLGGSLCHYIAVHRPRTATALTARVRFSSGGDVALQVVQLLPLVLDHRA